VILGALLAQLVTLEESQMILGHGVKIEAYPTTLGA
jgi:hypothetical protein